MLNRAILTGTTNGLQIKTRQVIVRIYYQLQSIQIYSHNIKSHTIYFPSNEQLIGFQLNLHFSFVITSLGGSS
jgi:hypothetical protein